MKKVIFMTKERSCLYLKKLRILGTILLGAFLFSGCGGEKVVSMGTLNGKDIDENRFQFYMDNLKNQYGSLIDLSEPNEDNMAMYAMIEQSAWDSVLQNTLVEVLAEEEDIHLSNGEVESTLDAQVAASFESEEDFSQWLEAMGYTRDDMLYLFRIDALSQKIFDKVTADITVTDEEAKAAYEENKEDWQRISVSHILIKAEKGTATEEELAAAKKKAEDIIKRLDAGEDFAALAKECSEDTTASAGGAMDYKFSKNDTRFVKEFVDGAFLLNEVGEYSKEPVQTDYGFHIIKIDTKEDSFDAAKEDIKESLAAPLKTEAFYGYLDEKAANIDLVVNYTFQYWTEGNEGNNANPFVVPEQDDTEEPETEGDTEPKEAE